MQLSGVRLLVAHTCSPLEGRRKQEEWKGTGWGRAQAVGHLLVTAAAQPYIQTLMKPLAG